MPVFQSGIAFAQTLAHALKVPLYTCSHQQGHIAAAIEDISLAESYLSIHLSGGTTEILCTMQGKTEIVGGTLDLHAGQLIDRVAVGCGLPFPCGAHIEKYLAGWQDAADFPICIKGGDFHLSGAEAKALQAIENGVDGRTVLKGVIEAVARSLVAVLSAMPYDNVVLAGGVGESSILRSYLQDHISKTLYMATPGFSRDNAYGVALIARQKHREQE